MKGCAHYCLRHPPLIPRLREFDEWDRVVWSRAHNVTVFFLTWRTKGRKILKSWWYEIPWRIECCTLPTRFYRIHELYFRFLASSISNCNAIATYRHHHTYMIADQKIYFVKDNRTERKRERERKRKKEDEFRRWPWLLRSAFVLDGGGAIGFGAIIAQPEGTHEHDEHIR